MMGSRAPTPTGASSRQGHPTLRAFGLAARQGEPYWTDGTVTVVKAPPARTDGRLTVIEQLLVAGRPRAARSNPDGDEVWYVVDGILDVLVGPVTCTVESGGVLFVPRGEAVTVRVLSQTARILMVITPAGEETLRSLVTG